MWRRLLIVELGLAIALIYGGFRVRQSWRAFDVSHQVQSIAPEKEPARTLPQVNRLSGKPEDWTEISIKDPFSFDRNDVAIVAPKQAAPTQPKPVLFGTMSIGNEWIAMLAPALGGNRASQAVRVGQSIGDYWQLLEIHENSVVVVSDNGVRQTVILNDPTAQVPRSYERTLTGAAPPQVALPVVSPGTTPSPQQTVATPSAPQQVSPAGGEQPKPKILNTPFGPIIRTDPQ
jgi:hypothetical protein